MRFRLFFVFAVHCLIAISAHSNTIKFSCEATTAIIDDYKMHRLGGERIRFELPLKYEDNEYTNTLTLKFTQSPYHLKLRLALSAPSPGQKELKGSALVHLIDAGEKLAWGSALVEVTDLTKMKLSVLPSKTITKILNQGWDLSDPAVILKCLDSAQFHHGELLGVEIGRCRRSDATVPLRRR
jgi:hypothetical protein